MLDVVIVEAQEVGEHCGVVGTELLDTAAGPKCSAALPLSLTRSANGRDEVIGALVVRDRLGDISVRRRQARRVRAARRTVGFIAALTSVVGSPGAERVRGLAS